MKWIATSSLIVFALFSIQVLSAPEFTVHGILQGYEKDLVKIQTHNGMVRVPKDSVKVPLTGLMVGKATIQAKVKYRDMLKLNGNPFKAKMASKKKPSTKTK